MKRILTDTAIEILSIFGWSEDRNVIDVLELPNGKEIFQEIKKTLGMFALLKIEYQGRSGKEALYFDIDDSLISQKLRAEIYGYGGINDENISDDLEFSAFEDMNMTNSISKILSSKCIRIGFLENDLGYDIYINENLNVYLDHGESPFLAYLNFYDFINSTLLSRDIDSPLLLPHPQ